VVLARNVTPLDARGNGLSGFRQTVGQRVAVRVRSRADTRLLVARICSYIIGPSLVEATSASVRSRASQVDGCRGPGIGSLDAEYAISAAPSNTFATNTAPNFAAVGLSFGVLIERRSRLIKLGRGKYVAAGAWQD